MASLILLALVRSAAEFGVVYASLALHLAALVFLGAMAPHA
jgi:hypothetical protein